MNTSKNLIPVDLSYSAEFVDMLFADLPIYNSPSPIDETVEFYNSFDNLDTPNFVDTIVKPPTPEVHIKENTIAGEENDFKNIAVHFLRRPSNNKEYSLTSNVQYSKNRKIGKGRQVATYAIGISLMVVRITSDSGQTAFTLSNGNINSHILEIPFANTGNQTRENFQLIPVDRKNVAKHSMIFSFYDNDNNLVCSHTISDIYIAGHKYESGKKQKLFYANENSFLEYNSLIKEDGFVVRRL